MGLFISFEGMDASGKSTQLHWLENYLKEQNLDYLMTREPGGTEISENIRRIILDINYQGVMDDRTEALLYAASRAQHVNQFIKPALKNNKIIICDRYVDSSYVYQGFGRNLGIDNIKAINDFATGSLMPDLTIVFTITYEEMLRRKNLIKNEKLDRIEVAGKEFFEMVYDSYQKLGSMFPDRIVLIDGMRDIFAIEEEIKKIVSSKIKQSELENNISYVRKEDPDKGYVLKKEKVE